MQLSLLIQVTDPKSLDNNILLKEFSIFALHLWFLLPLQTVRKIKREPRLNRGLFP